VTRKAHVTSACDAHANPYAISLTEFERDAHVPPEDTVVEVPSQQTGPAPGDDDLSRQQRDALRAGG
jgi:hypothetical protein